MRRGLGERMRSTVEKLTAEDFASAREAPEIRYPIHEARDNNKGLAGAPGG